MAEKFRFGRPISSFYDQFVLEIERNPLYDHFDNLELPENAPPEETLDLTRFGYHHAAGEPAPAIFWERSFIRMDGNWYPETCEFSRGECELAFLSYLDRFMELVLTDVQHLAVVGLLVPERPDRRMMELPPDWPDAHCRLDFEQGIYSRWDDRMEMWTPVLSDLRVWQRREWRDFRAYAEAESWGPYSEAAGSERPAANVSSTSEKAARTNPLLPQPQEPMTKEGLRKRSANGFMDWWVPQLGETPAEQLLVLNNYRTTELAQLLIDHYSLKCDATTGVAAGGVATALRKRKQAMREALKGDPASAAPPA